MILDYYLSIQKLSRARKALTVLVFKSLVSFCVLTCVLKVKSIRFYGLRLGMNGESSLAIFPPEGSKLISNWLFRSAWSAVESLLSRR